MLRYLKAGAVAVTAFASTTAIGGGYYWMMPPSLGGQANPEIRPCEQPYTNDGGGKPKSDFKAGETLYTMRNDMFIAKVTGEIQRSFIRDTDAAGGNLIKSLDLIMPPKLTPSGVCSKANFATPIPRDLPPGMYTYSVTVFMRKNMFDPRHATPFPPVRFRLVE